MAHPFRRLFPFVAIAGCLSVLIWSVSYEKLPPADFTFSNGTEIKSLDPAVVTGQPEGRIIRGLFEGLVDWHPKDLHPVPGVAESWDISDDGTIYTFHLRKNARWSNGTPVTAHDFVYSFRRFLDPRTGAQYAFLLYHVKRAEEYNLVSIKPGDPVEIELNPTAAEKKERNGARGRLLMGRAVAVEEVKDGDDTKKIFTVEVAGKQRRFARKANELDDESIEDCRQVLLDFKEVAICALDDHTLRIELNNPTPYFLNLMGFYPLFPVNRECVEKYGWPTWTKPGKIVSNGPFNLEFRRIRDRIRLKKNPHYWDKKNVHFEIIDALAVESITTELNLYMTGKVDWFTSAPATIIPELLRQNRPDFQPQAYLAIYYYRVNTTRPPLNDPRVRRALALALDKRQIVEKVTRAGEIPADRYVPPGLADYEEVKARHASEIESAKLNRNVKRAKELLAEAGYPNGRGFREIELLYNTQDTHKQIAELIQSQWKEALNIDIALINKEWGSYLADQRSLNYDISRAGWIGDYADPNTFLDLFLSGGSQNQTGWGNDTYDKWIKTSSSVRLNGKEESEIEAQLRKQPNWNENDHPELLKDALDKARRLKRMEQFFAAEQILLDELPIIPLYYYVSKSMVRPYLKGWYHNIQDVHPFKGMRIDKKEKRKFLEAEGL